MNEVQDEEVGAKSKERRKQVLDAAAECFRDMGFHGCSIAKISKLAGMSPGHIYYHFANKEAIVEALVARQESTLYELINDIDSSPPDEQLALTLKRHTEKMVNLHTSLEFIGLWLEIAAEAARNANVAKVLRDSHEKINSRFNDQLAKRAQISNEKDIQQLRVKMEIIAAIFSGLSLHTAIRIHNEKSDNTALVETINDVIEHFFCEF
ncbi:TPA: TetR/AcrR family transcriptional regulator [Klebsiella michiganensis]|nr:TetR/AcrR family transcriptional regulator [Klebsiella michiganensis]